MFYRVKNFAVGSNELPRITLWKGSPARAYYFSGEIHICDDEIIPSSDRENLEQNDARERFYLSGLQISRTLNALAGQSSDQRRAVEFIEKAESTVKTILAEARVGEIPKEVRFHKMFAVQDAIVNVAKRLKDAPDELQERGEKVIDSGSTLLKELDKATTSPNDAGAVYDIAQTLGLGDEAARIYELIVQTLEEELSSQPELFEKVIRRIHAALGKYDQSDE
jgi:hypothetical protein